MGLREKYRNFICIKFFIYIFSYFEMKLKLKHLITFN